MATTLDFVSCSIYNLFMKSDGMRPEIIDQIASDCIAVRVRLINRVVTGIYDEALRPHGLRVSQGNILVAVARRGGARPADIARLLRIEKSTLSRDVEILKAKGWLRSDPPGGGRNQRLHVTQEGLDLVAESHPAWESAQAEARRLIGEEGVDLLRRVASRLVNGDPAEA